MAEPRVKARLSSLEVAEAAVLADLAVGLCLFGWLMPGGGLLTAAAVAPMAALGSRHRLAVVVAGGVSVVVTSMLIAGVGLASNAAGCAILGAVVGAADRRRWSRARTMATAGVTVWPLVTAVVVATLATFGSLRRLLLAQVVNSWHGTSAVLRRLHLGGLGRVGDRSVVWLVDHWWLSLPLALLAAVEVAVFVAQLLARPTLVRLAAAAPAARESPVIDDGMTPAPVPVNLERVGFRYAGASEDALSDISLQIAGPELLAVVGPNGSGKSTLARLVAGRPPTRGRVHRTGGVGLGRAGGTAVVFQRPESQVLGMRVRDDVLWGLGPENEVDVGGVLGKVGLAGFEDRDTAGLSGGELQRLAVAAALARRPSLLISDETTAMVDADGRGRLTELLTTLPRQGIAVVHVTHRGEEAAVADRVIRLQDGRVVTPSPVSPLARLTTLPRLITKAAPPSASHTIRFAGVGHVYDARSPWAHRALANIDLTISEGEGVLLCGPNGSGKSTLAWIMAGLTSPTEGTATLDGRPLASCLNKLGLSFQHARLQLQRPTVRADVRAAAATDDDAADRALAAVGLDPFELGDRGIDELSGGQQRRVALAGLLAAEPRVLILDEPFAGLDDEATATLTTVLGELRRRTDLTLVLISHDNDGSEQIIDRVVRLDKGEIVDDTGHRDGRERPGASEAACPTARVSPPSELRLFRVLPKASPLHRLWAGTKLLALIGIAGAVSAKPQWQTLAGGAALILAGLLVGRVPANAAPRLPRWLWFGLAASFLISLIAGGPPRLNVGPIAVGLGAAGQWVLATALAAILLSAAALVSWTTPLVEITPALHRLGRPLRHFRLPIDQWAIVTALGLRSLPILLDETRVLAAGRRMREAHAGTSHRRLRRRLREPADLLAAAAVSATRRAGEFADAIDARGGATHYAHEERVISAADVAVLAIVATFIAFTALV